MKHVFFSEDMWDQISYMVEHDVFSMENSWGKL